MRRVEPKVFLIGESRVVREGLDAYLAHVGAPEWRTDAGSDAEELCEVYGRLCYRSWKPGLNANVTKIREGSAAYLENILKVKHGAVIEHPVLNFVFADVSRVFTHELVRHRVGIAISQESLRYVRLEDLGQWLPKVVRDDPEVVRIFGRTFEELERLQITLARHFKLDDLDFKLKKGITSAMRRVAPIGLATTIGWSCNPRTLRWVIELRTAPEAEEEIRLVFGRVAELVCARYPNLFGGYDVEVVDGLPWYKARSGKV